MRHYDWGTRDFIPRLCGREPGDRPEAELWFGAHADAPAGVVLEAGSANGPGDAGRPVPLDRLIAERRREVLGPGAAGSALPFLTKILSAARPLSIQAHPDREQARRGFASVPVASGGVEGSSSALAGQGRAGAWGKGGETRGAAPVSDANRTYRDPNHKPELLYALTPFSALAGFRPAAEAAQLLAALGLEQLESTVRRLESEGAAAYRALLEALRRHTGTDLAGAAVEAAHRASTEGDADCRDAMHWIVRIASHHPDDPLVAAPLFLRLVHLEPGQALFTGPGVPHSYLEGSAIEVMANSDNVLRLGLTSKRVDAGELLDILVYEASAGAPLAPRTDEHSWGTRTCFQPPAEDFRLDVLQVDGTDEAPLKHQGRARITLALEGEIEVRNSFGTQTLRPGQAVLLPAAARAVTATGPGTLALTTSDN